MKYFDTVKLHSRVPGSIFRMFVLEMVIKCIADRGFLTLKAIFYVSLFTFPCVIILSTRYRKLSSITTVFSPQKNMKIGITQWQSVQGSQVLHSGLQILKFSVQGPGSFVLGPDFRLCHKKLGRREKFCAQQYQKFSISSSYLFLKCRSLYL